MATNEKTRTATTAEQQVIKIIQRHKTVPQ